MYDVSSIVCRRFPKHACRYLRITVPKGDLVDTAETGIIVNMIGFAEIEVLSEGGNVLAGIELSPGFEAEQIHNLPLQMTDGFNAFGRIINTRDWIEQLALRHDLLTERPRLMGRVDQLYAEQEQHYTLLKNFSFLIGGALVIIILLSHIIRLRQMNGLRQRLAADLHDQVGANLHAIGLLSDIAREEAALVAADYEQSSLLDVVGEIRDTTERTAASVRHCSSVLP